ncbi:hypothetical protein GLOIN_2v1766278 [Rhizophagus irregularis DAOM 181602=DAOM 197198]|nr:hypothetical protein GLOIN_2v1766278 [Rhizophagus irregularis DAOM 181602=DAOM 197198]
MITKNSMDEDYVADVQTADVGKDSSSSSSQQNISDENTLTSSQKNLLRQLRPVTSRLLVIAPSGNQIPDPVVILSITRDNFQAAAALNAAPKTLKKFTTNKALIEAVNNLFLETYESYIGKARMTGSGNAKRLVIYFHTAKARDLYASSFHPELPDLVFHAHDPHQLRSNKDLQIIQVTIFRSLLKKIT